jgi:hypothetical protein
MSKYDLLRRHLDGSTTERMTMTFAEIENVLGFRLPASARRHQAWWANAGESHAHAAAWLDAGWRTSQLELADERVTFQRLASGASQSASVEENGRPFRLSEVMVDTASLSPAAARLMRDLQEELGCGPGEAIVAAMNAHALHRKRRLLDDFPLTGERSPIDSADLIREDRDGR